MHTFKNSPSVYTFKCYLKVAKVLLLPFHGNPQENYFPTKSLQWNSHHIRMHYKKKIIILQEKKCCTVLKWWPNNRLSFFFLILFCVISILAKIWKTTFPKEFFNEI